MELYSILAVFFLIGGLGIGIINQKSSSVMSNVERWKKFRIYLILVFAQLYFINHKMYVYFAGILGLIGFYELIKIGKTLKSTLISVIVFAITSLFFMLFFKEIQLQWQQFGFIIVITFDGYSQIFGQLFGQTRLFPKTSPGKTLEGLLGGILSVVFTSLILSFVMPIEMKLALVFGLAIAALAIAGDFLASLLKRMQQVKDFSKLIPAHGGVLDRFDSLIFAGFGFYFLLKLDFSNPELLIFCLYVFLFLIIFIIAEVLYHSLRCKVEISRKFVHAASGIACLSFPFFLENQQRVLLLCSGFVLILLASQQLRKLPSINKIERKSYGSLLFPVSVYVCFLGFQHFNYQYTYFYLPIVILAFCDPIAALAGKKWPYGKYSIGAESKTAMGSLAFFTSCLLILIFSFQNHLTPAILAHYFVIGLAATVAEAISKKGFDNLTIPVVVLLCLILLK